MRILLVDDNALVRRAIRNVLGEQTSWEICGEASAGSEACTRLRDTRPDLILLDKSMPGLSGFETARLIRQEDSNVRILILSQDDPRHMLTAAIEAGADGCVDKSRISSDLIPAIMKFGSHQGPK
jgi:two-component system, NarL family, nitrate/nitrite response regulator NarL